MARQPRKVLGQTSSSLSVPIVAFTMAVLLGTYCITSIRAARREAKHSPGMYTSHQHQQSNTRPQPSSSGSNASPQATKSTDGTEASWVLQKLEKKREGEKAKEQAYKTLRGEGE